MKPSALALCSLVLLPPIGTPALAEDVAATFACGEGTLEATFHNEASGPGTVDLTLPSGGQVTLPQVRSADGGRYADGEVELWVKGNTASLSENGREHTCEAAS